MPFGANAAPTLCQRGANVVQICISKPTRRVLARRLCATRYRKFFLPVKHATCKNILLKLIGTKSRPTAPRARVDGCAAAAAAGRPPYLFRLCAQRSKSKKTEHPNSSISYSKPFQNKKKIKLRKLLIFYFPAGAVCKKKKSRCAAPLTLTSAVAAPKGREIRNQQKNRVLPKTTQLKRLNRHKNTRLSSAYQASMFFALVPRTCALITVPFARGEKGPANIIIKIHRPGRQTRRGHYHQTLLRLVIKRLSSVYQASMFFGLVPRTCALITVPFARGGRSREHHHQKPSP